MVYDDQDKIDIAWVEYDDYQIGEEVRVGKDKKRYGYISDIIGKTIYVTDHTAFSTQKKRLEDHDSGLDGYVVTDKRYGENETQNVKEITIFFEGSKFEADDIPGTVYDWGMTDAQMAGRILLSEFIKEGLDGNVAGLGRSKQLRHAKNRFKEIMDKYPNARVKLFAHSLGGMNGQSSIAGLEENYLQRIDGVYIYESPNIYSVLSPSERKQVDKIKYKIFNYVDLRDIVSMNYPNEGSKDAVGTVIRINSKDVKDGVKQHMWGGYDYKAGYLNVKEESLDDYRLARVKQAKEQLQIKKQALESWKKSGLSGNDLISMDTIQARGIVESLKEFALIASDYILAVCDFGIADVRGTWDTLLASCRSTVSGSRCTENDIVNALAQVGATKETIEINRITELEKIKKDILKIKESIFSLSTDIEKGIATVIGTDIALASQFQLQW